MKMEIEPLGAYLPFPRAPFSGAQWEQAGSLTSWDMPVIGLKPGSKPVGYTLSIKMGVARSHNAQGHTICSNALWVELFWRNINIFNIYAIPNALERHMMVKEEGIYMISARSNWSKCYARWKPGNTSHILKNNVHWTHSSTPSVQPFDYCAAPLSRHHKGNAAPEPYVVHPWSSMWHTSVKCVTLMITEVSHMI